jgi:hypothetical protein
MPSRNQKTGYDSNSIARTWLLDNGYTWVWLKPHPRFPDVIFINSEGAKLYAKDIWNMFDGICLKKIRKPATKVHYYPVFLQVKTNSWKGFKEIAEFTKDKDFKVIFINVKKGVPEVKYL